MPSHPEEGGLDLFNRNFIVLASFHIFAATFIIC